MPQEHKELLERIKGWLDDEGIPFESIPDFNARFHVKAQLKNITVHVSESVVRIGCIVVQGVMGLDRSQLELVAKLKPEDRRALYLSVYYNLDKKEYLFQVLEDFTNPTWLKIQRTLYVDDITRSALLREMKDLNMCIVNVNYTLNQALGNDVSLPPAGSSTSPQFYS